MQIVTDWKNPKNTICIKSDLKRITITSDVRVIATFLLWYCKSKDEIPGIEDNANIIKV